MCVFVDIRWEMANPLQVDVLDGHLGPGWTTVTTVITTPGMLEW